MVQNAKATQKTRTARTVKTRSALCKIPNPLNGDARTPHSREAVNAFAPEIKRLPMRKNPHTSITVLSNYIRSKIAAPPRSTICNALKPLVNGD